MTKVNSGDITQLHYALTESECNACGSHLEWQPNFNDISIPRYVSYHCNYQYIIYIDNVKIDVLDKAPDRKERDSLEKGSKDEPRAILIAQKKKKERQESERKPEESF